MHPLRHDDPRRLGPYAPLFRLDDENDGLPWGERRFLAKSTDGARTVVVTAPLRGQAASAAFLAEAEQARRAHESRVPWLAPVSDIAGPTESTPWYATRFAPALPLSDALAAHSGPLPERVVRLCGAALAEAVARLHALGLTHAGLSPRTVLLTASGPRLTGFGVVRVAAPEGRPRTGSPELASEFLPPEQAAGGRPRPLGDVHALGAVLAYAATGRTGATPDEVPEGLRDVLRACLASDPAERPVASALVDRLLDGQAKAEPSPVATVLDGTVLDQQTSRAETALLPGWLPHGVSAALAVQAADVLDAELPEEEAVAPVVPVAEPAAVTDGTLTLSGSGAHRPSRRALVTGLAAGTAGLALGGTAAWAATAEDPPEPTAAQRYAVKRRSRKRLTGAPPNPRWHTRLDLPSAPRHEPLLWGRRMAVVQGGSTVIGLDLATGHEAWRREDLRPSGPLRLAEGGLVLVPGAAMSALDARTGKTRWKVEAPRAQVLGVDGGTVWFFDGEGRIVAYDAAHRRRLWSEPAPDGMSKDTGGHLLPDTLVVRSPGPGRRSIRVTAYSRRSGERQWSRTYGDAFVARAQATMSEDGTLLVAAETRLKAYESQRAGGEPQWDLRAPESEEIYEGPPTRPFFGGPVVHGDTVFVSDSLYIVRALDVRNGKEKWAAKPRFAYGNTPQLTGPPVTVVSPSGRTLLAVSNSEVAAYEAKEGTALWRFTQVGPGKRGALPRHEVAMTDASALVVGGRDAYLLPLT
ncbi:hypothetical protein GCM10009801_78720 [Streptomyces albiaxialis]|uniref:Protein kinase domain-containing protein n=1 Tax=Streptomyces albiaxialis TaxID=329523 RepID=A0ABN2X365_9ACTN